MQMNWKVRFRNKVWLSSFIATIMTFVYTILGMFDIAPEVTQNSVMNIINAVLMMLCLTGVVVDPTTSGISDSNRAMSYEVPYVDPDSILAEEDSNELDG